MPSLDIGLAVPDLRIPRWGPCSALVAPSISCGATPASRYARYCTVPSHVREIRLCPVHAALVASGGATCHECAQRGGISPVLIIRLSDPVRIP